MTAVEAPIAMDHVTYRYSLLPLGEIRPSPTNPRKRFDEAGLLELAESIRQFGVLEPIIVRPLSDDDGATYEIVAGERRWRAAKLAGVPTIPAIKRRMTDAEALEIQVVENNQRQDVSPLEEAEGFSRLIEIRWPELSVPDRVRDLAARIGRSPRYVTSRLKLRGLIPQVRTALDEDRILLGHALALVGLPPESQLDALGRLAYETRWDPKLGAQRISWDEPRPEPRASVKFFREHVEREYSRDLATVEFDQTDPELNPSAGPCATCPKRSGVQAALWHDEESPSDRCLDGDCFRIKLETHCRHLAERALAADEPVIAVAYGNGKAPPALPCKVLANWQVQRVAEGDTLAIDLATGETFRTNLTAKGANATEEAKLAKERARRLVVRDYRRRLKWAIEENLPATADVEAFRTLARITILDKWDQARTAARMGWPNEEFAERLDRAGERELIELMFLRGVAECLRSDADPVESPYVYDGQMTPAETLAKTLGLNPAAIKKAVEAELKPDSGANPKPRKGEKPEAGS